MRLVVFGSAGMLGKAVMQAAARAGIEGEPIPHSLASIESAEDVQTVMAQVPLDAVVINCAGVIPAEAGGLSVLNTGHDNLDRMVRVNALGPRLLARTAFPRPLIHVSTDCVFGRHGSSVTHAVTEPPFPDDVYGFSKRLGELLVAGPHVTVVRTSFVGLDHGLMWWLLDNAAAHNASVPGWTRAWWSGSTVEAVAAALIDMALAPPGGIQHLATSFPITKEQALHEMVAHFGLDIRVEPTDEPLVMRGLEPTITLRAFRAALEAVAL